MGDVHLKVFVGFGVSRVAVQCEGFPLAKERCGCDDVIERMVMSRWLWW